MSPEQARGDSEVTYAADLYSIGVILYEMLLGHVPITGENYNQLIWRVMNAEYEPPRVRRPDLPVELEQIILRAMATDPRARFASAAELEHALLAFCRSSYREHMIERLSNAGIPWGTPPPATSPPHRSSQPPAGPMQGTDPTLIAPTGMHPKSRSKLPFVLAGVLLLGGGAAAVVATQSGSSTAKPLEPVAAAAPAPTPTPAPNPPAAPPAPAPAPVAAPARITIKVTVDPSTAIVTIDGKPVTGELVVDKDAAEHELSITAPGFTAHLDKQRSTRPTRPTKPRTNHTERIDTASPYGD
jgi:serine/threonine-protein kinase